MGIKYFEAEDMRELAKKIVLKMGWTHINLDNVAFLRSTGSSSRGTIARCHALSRPLQLGLKREGFYLIEIISERFDKMPEQEKVKVMIHELMHIPKAFGGGFIHHHMVNERTVNKMYEQYRRLDGGEEVKKESLGGERASFASSTKSEGQASLPRWTKSRWF